MNKLFLFGVLFGSQITSFAFAQYDPINPFIMPNDTSMNWYGSGDINNDNRLDIEDLMRLDSILSGQFSDLGDKRLNDRADINGDQEISMVDRDLMEAFLDRSEGILPAHWNKLKTRNDRISWLEKVIAIDQTELIWETSEFVGDFHCDQLLINLHGYSTKVLELFQSPIDHSQNGRFNLPVTYAGISFNRTDFRTNRNLVAILVGDNVFDWNDWCFIDPQWDQLVFAKGFEEPAVDESFPLFGNWLDDIPSFTVRDTIPPSIRLSLIGDSMLLDRGFFDLEYTLSDASLKSASYRIDALQKDQLLFKDSLVLDETTNRLVPTFDTSGIIHLLLPNGRYNFSMEAIDHFYNASSIEFLLVVDDPEPEISIFSPVQDSIYSNVAPLLEYSISESDFSNAWYSVDSGQTRIEIAQKGQYPLNLSNGSYQLILNAEDIFGNADSDTVEFGIENLTGMDSNARGSDRQLYCFPNPTTGILNIYCNINFEGVSSLHVIDMTGRSIMELEFNQQLESSDVKVVDLRGYPPGVYYLRCTWLKDNTIFYRFILQ